MVCIIYMYKWISMNDEKKGLLYKKCLDLRIHKKVVSTDDSEAYLTACRPFTVDIEEALNQAKADFPTVESEDFHGCSNDTVNQLLSIKRYEWYIKWFGE